MFLELGDIWEAVSLNRALGSGMDNSTHVNRRDTTEEKLRLLIADFVLLSHE